VEVFEEIEISGYWVRTLNDRFGGSGGVKNNSLFTII